MLIIASTHIGNIEDTPSRSLEWVRRADVLVFEEARPARQVLKAAGVHRDFFRLNEHDGIQEIQEVIDCINQGQTVLYMSDQGTANIADPGRALVAYALDHGIKIEVIPGPSSVTAALSVCPFAIDKFFYRGFLPQKSDDRKREIKKLRNETSAVVILDTPYRRNALLKDLFDELGKRKVLVAVDISGENERYTYGTLKEVCAEEKRDDRKLNFVVVLGPT